MYFYFFLHRHRSTIRLHHPYFIFVKSSVRRICKQTHFSLNSSNASLFGNINVKGHKRSKSKALYRHFTVFLHHDHQFNPNSVQLRLWISAGKGNMQRNRRRCESTAMVSIILDLRPGVGLGPFALGKS